MHSGLFPKSGTATPSSIIKEVLKSRCGRMRLSRLWVCSALACLCVATLPASSYEYSVITHEAIIDAEWETSIQPLLLKRFPNASPDDLRKAQGYAYGGCII